MNELRRILSDTRRKLILPALPFLCLGLFLLQQMGGNIRGGWELMQWVGQTYRERVESWRGLEPEEILAQAQATRYDGLGLYEQAEHVRDYEAYLKTVQEQAARMSRSSLFGGDKNSFVYRNIQKTAADFKSLEGIRAEFGSDRAVEQWIAFQTADWFHLLAVILFVLAFLEDRRRGLLALVRSTPGGRKRVTISRLAVLLGVSFVSALLFCGLPLAASFAINGGLSDLGRSIQSLQSFKTCPLHLTVGGWILLYFAVKVVCGFFVGVFFWFILSFLEHIQLAWLVIIGILGAEYMARRFIAPQMALGFLRYLNIFSYISPAELLSRYQNMNFFGWPVGSFTLMAWLLLVLFVLLTAGLMLIQTRRHPFGNRDVLGRLIRGVNRFFDFFRRRLPIGLTEAYKLLFLGGTLIFLLIGVYVGWGLKLSGSDYNPYSEPDAMVMAQYVKEAKGPITQETWDYLERAQAQLDARPTISNQFRGGLNMLKQEVAERQQKAAEGGYEPWLMDQVTINNYYGEKVWYVSRWNALLVMFFAILCAAPVFAFEEQGGTARLLRSMSRGRSRVFLHKYLVVLLEALVLWAVVFGREWREIREALGREFLAAPAQNAAVFEALPVRISLGGALLLLNLIRLAGLLVTVLVTAWLSRQVNTWEKAVMPAAALLLMPAALLYFDQDWARVLSLLPFTGGAEAMAGFGSAGLYGFLLLPWLALGVFLTLRCRRSWVKTV